MLNFHHHYNAVVDYGGNIEIVFFSLLRKNYITQFLKKQIKAEIVPIIQLQSALYTYNLGRTRGF